MKKLLPVVLGATLVSSLIGGEANAALKKPVTVWKVSNTAGFVDVDAAKNSTVYIYKGGKSLGKAKAGKYGSANVSIQPQKKGTVLRVFYKTAKGTKSPETKVTVTGNYKKKKQLAVKKFTLAERYAITNDFVKWASVKAKKEHKAVTTKFFDHGAAGKGDWYAGTPHGHMQVQDFNNPGYYAFGLHAIGGVAFYSPKDNQYGYSKDGYNTYTAEGYFNIAKPKTYVTKYVLGDNGVVYELKKKREHMSFSAGFGEYNDNGYGGTFTPGKGYNMIVSKDKAAQAKLKAIMKKYQ
ncbi:Ig-like domain-containing protein [Macrococcoides goetzii]|uniref:Ig-like domain-containing protein n=1 Tax=Macrococcus sp. PK TaxID=2801919 RepID=UPI001F0E0CFA|nr:Ig-like domain-containing protein [Macrococcus sp. PK]MCH4984412.1 hypothetical protein [Macrococcus sp. PK]MCH4985187.1 hypothetical protein [Macrococcus sp. PK]